MGEGDGPGSAEAEGSGSEEAEGSGSEEAEGSGSLWSGEGCGSLWSGGGSGPVSPPSPSARVTRGVSASSAASSRQRKRFVFMLSPPVSWS